MPLFPLGFLRPEGAAPGATLDRLGETSMRPRVVRSSFNALRGLARLAPACAVAPVALAR